MSVRYKKSEEYLTRALKSIPLGSQTFSKSLTQFPQGSSPFFIERGQGSKVWDIDGNEYIDFGSSLGSLILGYNDQEVIEAVQEQLIKGTIFPLSHPLEAKVAEKIIELVPCAEMVRFGKNGSDATTGAIRLARAYTKRDHVAVCGYHGWHDWYIGSTSRDLGVPESTKELTHKFSYNDIASLEELFAQHPGKIAAVIMEPMNRAYPEKNFLEGVKELAHKNGALLIFDEMITGFRFSLGGAQELFGVTPDLATFGKAVANGLPLSVLTGKKEIMQLLDEVFYSFTFGGETLSLASALATLTKLERDNIPAHIITMGRKLFADVAKLLEKHKLQDTISVEGHYSWLLLNFHETTLPVWRMKTFFLEECFKNGIMTIGSFFINNAHSEQDITQLLNVLDGIFSKLANSMQKQELVVAGKELKPLFVVR